MTESIDACMWDDISKSLLNKNNIRVVYPSIERVLETDPLLKLERMARICYQSENKIQSGSAERLLRSIIKRGHESVLEHYRIAITVSDPLLAIELCTSSKFIDIYTVDSEVDIPKSDLELGTTHLDNNPHVVKYRLVGNVRAWRDLIRKKKNYTPMIYLAKMLTSKYGILFSDLQTPATSISELFTNIEESDNYFTFIINTDRGVLAEISRHRIGVSLSVESTRYCNYNSGMTFCNLAPYSLDPKICSWWGTAAISSMEAYKNIMNTTSDPGLARSVLPLSLKTTIGITFTKEALVHFLKLRTASDAHPQIRLVAFGIQKLIDDNTITKLNLDHNFYKEYCQKAN